MKFELGFGKGIQEVEILDSNILKVLEPNDVKYSFTGGAEVERALNSPIGSPKISEIVKPGERIAIITSDVTRPMPTYIVMPYLLKELYQAGIRREDITLYFALGSHRTHTEEERRKLAGDQAFSEIKCIDANPDDCIRLGVTKRGTPVDIVRGVVEADRRICLGNIEYHYFAGYSGGAKAIMPGVSTREAISANHSRMVEASACAGKLEGNPVREDIEEAAAMCGIDFILNVVLDEHKKIIHAAAGDATQAHRAGCKFLDTLYCTEIPERADIVIVSQGGAPKDINLYQTQKALDNAKHAVKPGGIVILVGSCKEGLGEHEFEEWMTKSPSPASMIERIEYDFRLGGHKAAAIAMVLQNSSIFLVSDLEPEFVEKIFLRPFDTVQNAFDTALQEQGSSATIIVMPYGGSTLPRVTEA